MSSNGRFVGDFAFAALREATTLEMLALTFSPKKMTPATCPAEMAS